MKLLKRVYGQNTKTQTQIKAGGLFPRLFFCNYNSRTLRAYKIPKSVAFLPSCKIKITFERTIKQLFTHA